MTRSRFLVSRPRGVPAGASTTVGAVQWDRVEIVWGRRGDGLGTVWGRFADGRSKGTNDGGDGRAASDALRMTASSSWCRDQNGSRNLVRRPTTTAHNRRGQLTRTPVAGYGRSDTRDWEHEQRLVALGRFPAAIGESGSPCADTAQGRMRASHAAATLSFPVRLRLGRGKRSG
jgi:hypothetical protein